jgi:sodium transport system ATP-binding protein
VEADVIEIRQLHKRYGAVAAVNGVSFVAANGAITGLLGENGAGKTTTLGMVCGLLTPDSGSVLVDGVVSGSTACRSRIGALLDHTGLYPRLTARENVLYHAELQGLRTPAMDTRVAEILEALRLDRIADRPAGGFSHGERVRVAIARAIVHGPQNVILDEPTSGLDVPTVRALRDLLRHMRGEGRCVVFSSHVLAEVRALCDHVVVLSRGQVAGQGSVDDICGNASLEDAFLAMTDRTEVLA